MRTLLLASLTLTASACTQPESAGETVRVVAFENCTVVTMADEALRPHHTVLIEGDRIVAIGLTAEIEVPSHAEQIACDEQFLMPGLTDAHVHIGDPSELVLYLRAGVTTVFNLSGDYIDLFAGDHLDILALRDSVVRGEMPGPTIYTAGQALDSDPASGPFQRALASDAAAVAAVDEQHAAGYDFIKVYDALTPARHAAILQAAHEHGLPVFGHIPEAVGVEGTLASGQAVIAHAEEFYSSFEGLTDTTAVITTLARSVRDAGMTVIPNTAFVRRLIAQLEDLEAQLARPDVEFLAPRVRIWWDEPYNYYTGRDNPEAFLTDTRAKYRWLLPLVSALHREEVLLLTGSDAAVPVALPGTGVHDELADLVSAGLSPYEALRTATTNAGLFAEANGLRDAAFGTLQVGHRADLVMLRENPLVSIRHLEHTTGTMAQGRWYPRDALEERLPLATASSRPPE